MIRMGRPPISAEQVLADPVRAAVLGHIRTGKATAISIADTLGIERRGCLANHLSRLHKFGLISRRISRRPGGGRELVLKITPKGIAILSSKETNTS
jgi:predicted ArsR family transcriptional regulator